MNPLKFHNVRKLVYNLDRAKKQRGVISGIEERKRNFEITITPVEKHGRYSDESCEFNVGDLSIGDRQKILSILSENVSNKINKFEEEFEEL